jgi:hypothetical protein
MPNDCEYGFQARTNQYVVLLCGLNIRDQNRITLEEQRLALETVATELEVASVGGDKGSYLIASRHPAGRVVDLVLGALHARRPDLTIPGAAITFPTLVANTLAALANVLVTRYGNDFTPQDHGIKLGEDIWRAGLALPLFPFELPPDRAVFHKIKNAMVLGWTSGCVLVAKRQTKNIHWGKTVTGPASSQMRLHGNVLVELTSRSANVLRDLVG